MSCTAVDSFSFLGKTWSHTVLSLTTYHSSPPGFFCSVCCCEAALKETNKQGMTLDLVLRGYFSSRSSHRVCLWCSSTKRRCVCRNKEPFAVHSRRGGQWEQVLKKKCVKLLYLSNLSNGIQAKSYSPCCTQPSITLQVVINSSKNPNSSIFFQ